MKQLFVILLTLLLMNATSYDMTDLVRNDPTLVAPGQGAEGIVLGSDISTALSAYSTKRYSVSRKKGELFADILKTSCPLKIYYTTLYSIENRVVIFEDNGKVAALCGLSSDRITSDAVDLKKGIEALILYYGNDGLVQCGEGDDRIYIFTTQGLAVFDDRGDGSIDMYLVFKTSGE